MGRFREAFESQMLPPGKGHARYGQPATDAAFKATESVLGLPLPGSLRELYSEFDGLWYDELARDTPPDNDTEWWEVLPLSLLGVGRGMLTKLYGQSDEPGYESFDEQLGRCVAFCLPESGASFKFMTDRGAWGVARGLVGGWSHDGGVYDSFETLAEWLAEIGWMRSRGL